MVRERNEVDGKYKWDVESIYNNTEEWEKDFEKVKEDIIKLNEFEGEICNSPESLIEFLELREDANRRLEKLSRYARMKYDEDTRVQDFQALKSRASSLGTRFSSATSFVVPEIQEAGREKIENFMGEEKQLAKYEQYFDDILRREKHTRSKEVENVLSSLGDVLSGSSNTYSILTNADIEFGQIEHGDESIEITKSNFTTLLQDKDREKRRKVYKRVYDRLHEFRNTISTTMETQVKKDVKLAENRNYDSARERSLNDSNIPIEVYDNLVDVASQNADLVQRHAELKKKVLEVDEMKMHDIYMPLAESESPEIEYEDAKEHVIEAVKPLGEEYQEKLREGLESGWIDVYENKGKRSGAYSGGAYDTKPFILLNYQNDVSSMFTLAHELGHSMHSKLAKESQPYIYSGYEIFVAEVASTVNEALLARHLLNNVEDEEFRKHVLSHFLENFRSTFFRQTMFAEFEQEIHEKVENGEALTAEELNEVYGELKSKYYSNVGIDERIKREWMRIPHFYYNFYVFQYSTGISSALDIVSRIMNGEEGAVEDYLEMLGSGSSDYPVELLKGSGVDLTTKEPFEKAMDRYEKRLDQMEELVQ
ncbi:MAG: oligoendopeptidase F [Nanohaloarchaea archaeon]|nr:oligoendopeptidase F [Candidatus Nanohaloarchaea archaeon]